MIDSNQYFYSMCKSQEEKENIVLYKNVSLLFENVCQKYSQLPCMEWDLGCKTFNEVHKDVSRLRTFYSSLNLKRSAHIGLIFKNEYDFVINFFAIVTLGFVVVAISPSLSIEAYSNLKNKFDIDVLVFSKTLENIEQQYKNKFQDNNVYLAINPCLYEETLTFNIDINDFDPACIIFTGGTTSSPKGAVLSHRNLCRGAVNGCFVPTETFKVKFVSLIPFTHVFGLVKNLLSCFLTGSCLYIISNMFNFVKEMPKAKPNVMVLTPALVNIVITLLKKFGPNIFGGKLHTIIAGGAPVFKEMIEELLKFNINCFPGYGLTESTNLISGNGTIPTKGDSVGVVYPECELKIIDNEIVIKGDNVFLGYYKDKEATDKVLIDGWLHTGDLGYLDNDGFLYVKGRINSLIVLPSGLKFSPEEIEKEINKCKMLTDSMVYFDKENNLITAEIYIAPSILSNVAKNICENDIKEFIFTKVNVKFPDYIRVQKVIFKEEDFKRSPAMKIIREHR